MKLAFKEKAIQVQKNIQYNQVSFYTCMIFLKMKKGSTTAGYTDFIYLFIYLFSQQLQVTK